METKAVNATQAPQAIGPYSQAVKFGDLVFTSGQIPIDPASGNTVDGGLEAQVRQALENLIRVLEAAGASLKTVLKTTLYIKNMDDFNKINEIYAEFFSFPFPARSCLEAAGLPKGVLIEIEAVAYSADG